MFSIKEPQKKMVSVTSSIDASGVSYDLYADSDGQVMDTNVYCYGIATFDSLPYSVIFTLSDSAYADYDVKYTVTSPDGSVHILNGKGGDSLGTDFTVFTGTSFDGTVSTYKVTAEAVNGTETVSETFSFEVTYEYNRLDISLTD